MAWPSSTIGFLLVRPWLGSLAQTATQIFDLDGDTFKVALYNNSGAYLASDTLPNSAYSAGPWVVGNECTGTGWTAGGFAPGGGTGSPALSESPSGTIMWTLANLSQTGTTLGSVFGCLIYDSSLSGAKYAVCAVPFGSSAFTTTAGTFGITWAAGGIFNIDITP